MKNTPMYNKVQSILRFKLICIMFVAALSVFGQQLERQTSSKTQSKGNTYPLIQITGKVTDAATGLPLAGVHVQAYSNDQYTAMSDQDGKYAIQVPEYVTSLAMSVEGYNLIQCAINDRTEGVNVSLSSGMFNTNYAQKATAAKRKAAGNFQLVSELSIDSKIQASLGSDVRTIMRSGQPGIGAVMFMNGLNSLNSNAQPLFVLDGVLLDMQFNRYMVHDGYYNNLLSNISVEDIENVTVLKNGTSAYGAKGANGVILIDTKRNKSMTTKIDVSLWSNYELVPLLPTMMDASQYRSYASELLGSTGTDLMNFKFLKDDQNYYYYKQYHNNTDWTKETYQNAFTQSYGINVQGGDDVANYNLSVGYAQGNSTLKKNDFSRFNLRLNSDIFLFKNLTTRLDASFSNVNRNLRDDGVTNDFESATITSPGFLSLIKSPFLNPYAYDTKGVLSTYFAGADDYLNEVIGQNVSLANPCSILKYGEAKNKNSFDNSQINVTIAPKYQVNKSLSVNELFSYRLTNTYENYYLPMTGVPVFTIKNIGQVNNMAKSIAARQNEFFSETNVKWGNRYGAHTMQMIGGFRLVNNAYSLNYQKGYNTANDKTPNMSLGLKDMSTSGVDDKSMSLTYFVQGDYNFKEKYYLSCGLGVETSSKFGKTVKDGLKIGGVAWGLFPSIQGAWLVSSEPWFKCSNLVNHMKLNVGYDVSGNDDVDYIASHSYFNAMQLLNSIGGLNLANIGNTSLQWETTKRLTAGLDLNLFNNRLYVQANVFKGLTSNLLSLKELSYLTGMSNNWSNDGSLENVGYDLSINAKVLNLKNLKWDLGASVAHYDNKITALPNKEDYFTTEIYGATVLSQVGLPVGVFYGYKTDGVYSTTIEANNDGYYLSTFNGTRKYFKAGDVKFVNKDATTKEINAADRQVIGNPNPDFYGNLISNIQFKHVSLNVVLNYSIGNDVFNYERSVLESGSRFFNQTTVMTNHWIGEGQLTNIPRINYQDVMGNNRFSDRWIEDGSYVRVKTVRLSYALPLNNEYIQGFSIWCSANNLLTMTNYLGSDPEFSLGNSTLSQGIDRGLLAPGKSFTVGIKLNL